MATPAQRLIQDQNSDLLFKGTTSVGKTGLVNKGEKKGGLGGRKALNDISNSRKPSVFQPTKKDSSISVIAIEKDPSAAKAKISKATEKGKVGTRKALTDLTNSVKPSSQQVSRVGRKLDTVSEVKSVASSLLEERFLHNHHECIKAQMMAMDVDYFLESVGLKNDIPVKPSAMRILQSSSKKLESNMKHLEIEEMSEQPLADRVPLSKKYDCSPASCRSPKSPKPLYGNWDEESFLELMVMESPKLL